VMRLIERHERVKKEKDQSKKTAAKGKRVAPSEGADSTI